MKDKPKITNIKLIEIVAKWMGYELRDQTAPIFLDRCPMIKDRDHWVYFDPIHDRNDLDKVVVKLPFEIVIDPPNKEFWIKERRYKYPDDYAMAILEMVVKLYREEK